MARKKDQANKKGHHTEANKETCSIRMSVAMTKALTERHVVGLQHALAGGLRLGKQDGGERLARGREGAVVDAGGAHPEGDGEGGARVLELHRVQHDRREVALRLGRAGEVREFSLPAKHTRAKKSTRTQSVVFQATPCQSLQSRCRKSGITRGLRRSEAHALEDAAQRLGGGRPRAALLLEAEVVQRRLDRHDDVAGERLLLRGNVVAVAFGERGLRGGLGEVDGGRSADVCGSVGSLTNRHFFFEFFVVLFSFTSYSLATKPSTYLFTVHKKPSKLPT